MFLVILAARLWARSTAVYSYPSAHWPKTLGALRFRFCATYISILSYCRSRPGPDVWPHTSHTARSQGVTVIKIIAVGAVCLWIKTRQTTTTYFCQSQNNNLSPSGSPSWNVSELQPQKPSSHFTYCSSLTVIAVRIDSGAICVFAGSVEPRGFKYETSGTELFQLMRLVKIC